MIPSKFKRNKKLGITFHSAPNLNLQSFIKFPLNPDSAMPFTEANWGPQDQSNPQPGTSRLELFKPRSISVFIIWTNVPLHWMSKCQTITARSSEEAEICVTDECVRYIIFLRNLLNKLELVPEYFKNPVTVYNNNDSCIVWSHNMTTQIFGYLQIR